MATYRASRIKKISCSFFYIVTLLIAVNTLSLLNLVVGAGGTSSSFGLEKIENRSDLHYLVENANTDVVGSIPRCREDGHRALVEEYDFIEGKVHPLTTLSLSCGTGAPRSLTVVRSPPSPSLLFPFNDWSYRFSVGGVCGAASGSMADISFTVQALCSEEVLCEATLTYEVASCSSETNPTGEPEKPSGVSLCAQNSLDKKRSYEVNETYMGAFPLDVALRPSILECSPEVVISMSADTIPYGLFSVLPSSAYPLSYAYVAPPTLPEESNGAVSFYVPYAIQCFQNQRLLCKDELLIKVEQREQQCPGILSFPVAVSPSREVHGLHLTAASGIQCSVNGDLPKMVNAELSLISSTATSTSTGTFLIENDGQSYRYQAPSNEADVVASVSIRCPHKNYLEFPVEDNLNKVQLHSNLDSGLSCRTRLVFIVTAKAGIDENITVDHSSPSNTTRPPEKTDGFVGQYYFSVPLGESLLASLPAQLNASGSASEEPDSLRCPMLHYIAADDPVSPVALPSASSLAASSESNLEVSLLIEVLQLRGPLEVKYHYGNFTVNLIGEFSYAAPQGTTQPFVEVQDVEVYCVTTFIGYSRIYVTNYLSILPTPTPNTTAPPSGDDVPDYCPNVYYFTTPQGVALSDSLRGVPGSRPCVAGEYYAMTRPPRQGTLTLEKNGDFLFLPLTREELAVEMYFDMYCLNRIACRGVAYMVASDAFDWDKDNDTEQGETEKDKNNSSVVPKVLSCSGTCFANPPWITLPGRHVWEDEAISASYGPSHGSLRRSPIELSATWQDHSLVVTVVTLIGNMGARYPLNDIRNGFNDSFLDTRSSEDMEFSPAGAFNASCLALQGKEGIAADVWLWERLNQDTGIGRAGPLYNQGFSWYQLFGGKHKDCDIFESQEKSCKYAPLLTPSSANFWQLAIKNCTGIWSAAVPYSVLKSSHYSEENRSLFPPFHFYLPYQMESFIQTEGVQPQSWLAPQKGLELDLRTHHVMVGLQQSVGEVKVPVDRPFAVDAQWFNFEVSNNSEFLVDAPYLDDANVGEGDLGFGINLLLYWTADESDGPQIAGFKWLQQHWNSPGPAECPLCTGTKQRCYAGDDFTVSSYEGPFPSGDCPPSIGRVYLFKGPSNYSDNYQNLTLRGVVPGSRFLTTELKNSFQFDGSLLLQTLTKGGLRYNIYLQISLSVTYLSTTRVSTEVLASHLSSRPRASFSSALLGTSKPLAQLRSCRASRYGPVLDPLGYSTPFCPLPLSGVEEGTLCVDSVSTTYGPTDWALFVLSSDSLSEVAGVEGTNLSLTIDNIYVQYQCQNKPLQDAEGNPMRVYLRYVDPLSLTPSVPSAAQLKVLEGNLVLSGTTEQAPRVYWWEHAQPYLAFRNLENVSLAGSMSNHSGEVMGVNQSQYAFLFIPGAVGCTGEAEIVVEAELGATTQRQASRAEFRRLLHISTEMTERARYGVPISNMGNTNNPSHEKQRMYAMMAIASVIILLVISVVVFFAADNHRPLPRWIPRSEVVRATVLSSLPAGLIKPRKKVRRIVTADHEVIEVPKLKTKHTDMYAAMESGRYD